MKDRLSDTWISMAEAAKRAGVPPWKFRRRLKVLDERSGGKLLKTFGRGKGSPKLYVSAEALRHHLTTDEEKQDSDILNLKCSVERLTLELNREKKLLRATRRQVKKLLNP